MPAIMETAEIKNELLSIYANCVKSRYLDEELQRLYHSSKKAEGRYSTALRRPLYSAVGNELGPSIVTILLGKEDILVPRYRGYAAVLGKGASIEHIAAEVFGKKTGTVKGIGDSSSFKDSSCGISGYTTVLGANFSIAVGLAFAKKFKAESGIVVQLFGDGEASRSNFGSALNFASLWKLPLLFICENNGISINSKIPEMSATATIAERAGGYGIEAATTYETKPLHLYERAKNAIKKVREEHRPVLLEIISTRFASHSSRYDEEPFLGTKLPKNDDPLNIFEIELKKLGIGESNLLALQEGEMNTVKDSIKIAKEAQPMSEEDFFAIYHE